MSAKGRRKAEGPTLFAEPRSGSLKVNGRDTEFHPTEPWVVEALLTSPLVTLPPGGRWIEPCAGTGSIVRAVNRLRDDVDWIICELNPDMAPHLTPLVRPGRDVLMPFAVFVTSEWSFGVCDVMFMNPPFGHSLAFVEAGLCRARTTAMLNRLGWFGTDKRASWLRLHCPDVYTLPKRPSFSGDGATDMTEYAWFVWPESDRRLGTAAMLDMPDGGQGRLFDTAARPPDPEAA